MSNPTIGIIIHRDILDQIEAISKAEHCTKSDVIRRAIFDYLQERKHQAELRGYLGKSYSEAIKAYVQMGVTS